MRTKRNLKTQVFNVSSNYRPILDVFISLSLFAILDLVYDDGVQLATNSRILIPMSLFLRKVAFGVIITVYLVSGTNKNRN